MLSGAYIPLVIILLLQLFRGHEVFLLFIITIKYRLINNILMNVHIRSGSTSSDAISLQLHTVMFIGFTGGRCRISGQNSNCCDPVAIC